MIRDVIDTFRNTTPAVTQKFARKSQIGGSTFTGSHNREVDMSIIYLQVTSICCPMTQKFGQSAKMLIRNPKESMANLPSTQK